MRVMNKNKSLFESFQDNLKEATVDESWVKEQAEYYFNQDCQDSGDLDEIDYVDIIGDYTDNKAEAVKAEELIHNAWSNIKGNIYHSDYRKYIELSSNHTLFDISNDKFPDDEYAANEYNMQVEAAFDTFKEETGVELLALGRSGRHICVELTYDNALRFNELQEVQQRLEQQVIDGMNGWEPELESASVESLEEQDTTVRIITPQSTDRDYTITDITELVEIQDGDVQAPIDVTGLLNEVDARLNESVGENWGVINYQSTRFNSDTKDSNALFELCVGKDTYLMSMLLEENCTVLKVNNTKGQTIFKRKSNDVIGLAESYIRQFIPMNEADETNKTECTERPLKDRLEEVIAGNDTLKLNHDAMSFLIQLAKDDKDNVDFFKVVQNKIYAFVAELHANVQPCMPTDKDEQDYNTFDEFVEALFGKEFVKVEEENDEVPTVAGTETLKESSTYGSYKVGSTVYWIGAGNVISATGEIIDFPAEGRMTVKWDDGDVNTYDVDHPDIQHANSYDNSINEDAPVEEPEVEDEQKEVESPKAGLGTGYATFVRKPKDMADLDNKAKYFTDGESSYLIVSKEKLSEEEFDRLTDTFAAPNSYCKEFEALDSDNYSFNVIEFSCDSKDFKLLVDPSGSDYCRYVAKVGGNE